MSQRWRHRGRLQCNSLSETIDNQPASLINSPFILSSSQSFHSVLLHFCLIEAYSTSLVSQICPQGHRGNYAYLFISPSCFIMLVFESEHFFPPCSLMSCLELWLCPHRTQLNQENTRTIILLLLLLSLCFPHPWPGSTWGGETTHFFLLPINCRLSTLNQNLVYVGWKIGFLPCPSEARAHSFYITSFRNISVVCVGRLFCISILFCLSSVHEHIIVRAFSLPRIEDDINTRNFKTQVEDHEVWKQTIQK